jgi:hypothetical protein
VTALKKDGGFRLGREVAYPPRRAFRHEGVPSADKEEPPAEIWQMFARLDRSEHEISDARDDRCSPTGFHVGVGGKQGTDWRAAIGKHRPADRAAPQLGEALRRRHRQRAQ